MNKTALMNYALFARKELESQIALSLNRLGIYKYSIKNANIVGDFTVIEGTEESFPGSVYELRFPIISQVKEKGFDEVVEEYAYTWFNRIIAIRFMELHDYFDHGFRVLSSRDGSFEPEILKNVSYVINCLKLDRNVVISLHDQLKIEELYRYILFKQCNALSKTLPMLFDSQEEYMELLLPNNLLSKDSVIRQIEEIPEEDFLNDVEVIGWLYQFYNSVKKDQVFASKKAITKDTLPAVTQLFTPDWIVRYMAQNSIGKIWLESYPNSNLKDKMKYYVEDAKQEDDVQKQIDEIKYKNVNPEDIKIIEPCCGSGHILVYAFDLLLEMYKEKGYNYKDIPGKILSKNLYGLDVDKRAAQLSEFALMMKARSIDNRFFSDKRIVVPHVYEIQDSQLLINFNYKQNMIDFGFTKESLDIVNYLVETFVDGKVIGSLLKVASKDYQYVIDEVEKIKDTYVSNLLQIEFANYGLRRIEELCKIAQILSFKYDVMITNPPYCGISGLDKIVKSYFQNNYPDSKTDMFAMFMETNFVKRNGFISMINMQGWMYLSSYEKMRVNLLINNTIVNMLHLGAHAFETIGGEVVQTVSTIIRNVFLNKFNSKIINLTEVKDSKEKELSFANNSFLIIKKLINVAKILGSPICYNFSNYVLDLFKNKESIGNIIEVATGLSTSDNNMFLRFWHEIAFTNIEMNGKINDSNCKWFPMAKGGLFRKWYGNNDYVINYENNGKELKDYASLLYKSYSRTIKNIKNYGREGMTWSALTTGKLSIRYMNFSIFGSGASCAFVKDYNDLYFIMAFLNSSVIDYFMKNLNPTINVNVTELCKIPYISCSDYKKAFINFKVKECISLCKNDWDNFETSIDFKSHPLLSNKNSRLLFNNFELLNNLRIKEFNNLKENEEEINDFFIKLYGLQDELTCNVLDRDITISLANKEREIKSLISYFVGCIVGRYSLEHDGLIYAQEKGIGFDFSMYGDYVDDDGILPIYNFAFMEDGLTQKICQMVKRVYGDDTYKDNMKFIVSALDSNSNDSPEQILNRYLNNEFYNNHLKIYKKRPIYWMFSSGKHGAFKCLVYMHRYNKDTLARINTKYFLARIAMYKSEQSRLEGLIGTTGDAREKGIIQKQLYEVIACENELREYGQALDHMANQYIDIDLDDGVKVNYAKFQNVELIIDGEAIKKDLLVPIK